MVYEQPSYSRYGRRHLLLSGMHDDYEFWIIDLGTHPTAYVRIPIWHPCFKKKFMEGDEIDCIDVHGGITYSEDYLNTGDDKLKGWFIGWDYAHWRDHLGWETYDRTGRRWTTEEILEHVEDVIRQLKKAVEGVKA